MNNYLKPFSLSINELKHKFIYKYYQFRINTVANPYQIQFRIKPYQILLILSHMRSGSSLLTHILNSNPEIIGYGETHLNYSKEADFNQLMFKVYWRFKTLPMNHQYVLDKVLHNHKILDNKLLESPQIKVIFLLREPEKTLSSILTIKPHLNEEKALNYYYERLKRLEDYARIINNPQRSLLIKYDQLIGQSEMVFKALQNFLGTKEGFSEEYQILKTTGIRGIGDSSDNIKSGRILKNKQENNLNISAPILAKGRQEFDSCYHTLRANSSQI